MKKEAIKNSWIKTILLCMFLGLFGAHNFYNGKTTIGIVQLILSISCIGLAISMIWVLVDCIMILHDAYTDNNGQKLDRVPTVQSTGLLCFFLGFGGLHRFYTRHTALGWLQAFTLGGFFIWTLIDLVMILSGNFKDANGKAIIK